MTKISPSLEIRLPAWAELRLNEELNRTFDSAESRMRLAIALAAENVRHGTGGPFGAAVFEEKTGELISIGVNYVVTLNASIAHAETTAIAFAQQRVRSYDMAENPEKRYALYTSGQPCIMCFGVIWWSGLAKLVSAATADDIESIVGFKEGPLPANWRKQLESREGLPDIDVVTEFLRREACDVLHAYAKSGAPVYNAGARMLNM